MTNKAQQTRSTAAVPMPIEESRLNEIVAILNAEERKMRERNGWRFAPDNYWRWEEKKRWIHINCQGGSCGVFLVDKSDGEIYNIKSYGVPDYNKKKKADVGNIATADPVWLHAKRDNYLR